jgi:2-oxoglutarate dehydrogenase complex dehydrogenase (E1) component-like enzyme
VTTVALCSGKVFYDFAKEREARADLRVVAPRVEELYPFPAKEITAVLDSYPNARDVVWMQEEPVNMGSWWYVSQRLPAILGGRTLRYAGRDEAASPATGSYRRHGKEQAALLAAVFDQAPERPVAARPRRLAKAGGVAQAGAGSN